MLKVTFGGDVPVFKRAVRSLILHLDPDGGQGSLQATLGASPRPEPVVYRDSEDLLSRAATLVDAAKRSGQVPEVDGCDIALGGMRLFHDPEFGQFVLEGRGGETLIATPDLAEALRGAAEAHRAMGRGEDFLARIGPVPGGR